MPRAVSTRAVALLRASNSPKVSVATEPFAWSFNKTSARGSCLVEIVAENGVSGWGECFGPPALNAAIVQAYQPYLVGGDTSTLLDDGPL